MEEAIGLLEVGWQWYALGVHRTSEGTDQNSQRFCHGGRHGKVGRFRAEALRQDTPRLGFTVSGFRVTHRFFSSKVDFKTPVARAKTAHTFEIRIICARPPTSLENQPGDTFMGTNALR